MVLFKKQPTHFQFILNSLQLDQPHAIYVATEHVDKVGTCGNWCDKGVVGFIMQFATFV